jgi:2-oxoglutarate dehydrogenase E1 component
MNERALIYERPQGGSADDGRIFDAFRRWGYLAADLDPLERHLQPLGLPELKVSGPAAERARRYYCATIGADFMHIPDEQRRAWIAQRMESEAPAAERAFILERLARAEVFEQVLQARYLGTKRFSLEGVAALIPLLDEILAGAADYEAAQLMLGMTHRGRLNVMLNIVNRPAAEIVAGFEDVDPRSVLGGGDVKYHIGATGDYSTRDGRRVHVHLISNPSHLEAVDPIAMGRARAKQARFCPGEDRCRLIFPVLIHGDAAFAGQGIWAETLNLAHLEGYSVGGTVHIIANNLIGFTANPEELHSSRFAADLAKRQPIPIFHVNAEDPEAVVRVGRIAVDYRYAFASDVVVDLIGFRRHGHSEVEDPSITQPVLYKKISQHPPLYQAYAQRIGADPAPIEQKIRSELDQAQKQARALEKRPVLYQLPQYWEPFKGGPYQPEYEVATGVALDDLRQLGEAITRWPQEFHVHPKIKKLLEQRLGMASSKHAVDYGMAEALAFASLVSAGVPVRLSGQDSQRGTFNQRHAVLLDVENEQKYIPLEHVAAGQARFEVYNSELSEAGVLGFEYGYSRDFPETLVLWEAQFGDFANGAQVIIDQFISAAEDKWGLLSGLVLLLPHGYEGQGPEHSSARLERYLQLAANHNIQIAQPSNAAQYFHLLRRQALRPWRKPLVVLTPKSMLRHPDAVSPLADFTRERFLTVLPDAEVQHATRVLVCTGKIGHELRGERKRRKNTTTAIVFLEQLYPFPETELAAELERHAGAREIVWVQEEPANMGALFYVMPRLRRVAKPRPVRSIKRSAAASPATGSAKAHQLEQTTLLQLAFA